MTTSAACHILSAGFSFHRKPFHMSRSEGVQYYLLRLQTEGRSRTRRTEPLRPLRAVISCCSHRMTPTT